MLQELYEELRPFFSAKRKNVIVADFETTQPNDKNEVYVYLWCLTTIWDGKIYQGTEIDDFFEKLFSFERTVEVWFHNGAKFDFHYILGFFANYFQNDKLVFQQRFSKNIRSKPLEIIKTCDYYEENSVNGKLVLEPLEYQILTDNNKVVFEIKLASSVLYEKRHHYKRSDSVYLITFRDSCRVFPSTLEGYGKSISQQTNLKIKKGDFKGFLDIYQTEPTLKEFIRKNKNAEEHLSYVKDDVLILTIFLLLVDAKYSYRPLIREKLLKLRHRL